MGTTSTWVKAIAGGALCKAAGKADVESGGTGMREEASIELLTTKAPSTTPAAVFIGTLL
jgi:hypothetical protein